MSSQCKLLLGAAVLAGLHASPAIAQLGQFLGTWQNVNNNDSGAIRLNIAQQGNGVTVQVWGNCTPTDCDWGHVPATLYGGSVSSPLPQQTSVIRAQYIQSFAQRQVVIHPAPNNQLRVEVLTQFVDGSNRSNYADSDLFAKTTAPIAEDCISFNPATAQAALVQNSWKLVNGNMWMLDFGSGPNSQSEAQAAEAIVKRYKFTKQCFVGRPDPSFAYWLVGNASATGSIPKEDCVGFNPANVQVSTTGGLIRMVDGNHALFAFPNQAEAQRAVQIVKHYGFNNSCFVGRPGPSMTYQRR